MTRGPLGFCPRKQIAMTIAAKSIKSDFSSNCFGSVRCALLPLLDLFFTERSFLPFEDDSLPLREVFFLNRADISGRRFQIDDQNLLLGKFKMLSLDILATVVSNQAF